MNKTLFAYPILLLSSPTLLAAEIEGMAAKVFERGGVDVGNVNAIEQADFDSQLVELSVTSTNIIWYVSIIIGSILCLVGFLNIRRSAAQNQESTVGWISVGIGLCLLILPTLVFFLAGLARNMLDVS